MSEIENAKQELFNYIDNMTISDKYYDIILDLLNNTSDKLFTKIIEEIKDGNLKYEDFTSVFGNSVDFSEYFDNQHTAIMQKKAIDAANIANTNRFIESQVYTSDSQIVKTERENILSDIFMNLSKKNEAETIAAAEIIPALLNSASSREEFINNMLLSLEDFVVPMDYNLIKLNSFDLKYMLDNNISETDMKKMKAFTIYLANIEVNNPNI